MNISFELALQVALSGSIMLFAVFGATNATRRFKLLEHGNLGGTRTSKLLLGAFRFAFLPVTRSPLSTFLLATIFALSLLTFNFDHYFRGVGGSLFSVDHYSALLGVLAFIGSAIFSINSFNSGRVHTDELAIHQDILQCANSMSKIAFEIEDPAFDHDGVLEALEEFQKLKVGDIRRTKIFELMEPLYPTIADFAGHRFEDFRKFQFCGLALRLENACSEATLTFIRNTINSATWTRMASTLFAYLVVLLVCVVAITFWNSPPLGGVLDAVFLIICTATAVNIADFISYQLQDTRD